MGAAWPNNNATRLLDILGKWLKMDGDDLRRLNVVKLCIGGDGFGIHDGRAKTWSMGAMFTAPDDIPLDVKWKREHHWPLLMIPGPKQPKHMHKVLAMIVKELCRYAPTKDGSGQSIWVEPNSTDVAYTSFLKSNKSKSNV